MKIWLEFDDEDLKLEGFDLDKYYLQLLIEKANLESQLIRYSIRSENCNFGILINKAQEKTILISLRNSPSFNVGKLDGAFFLRL